jgi:CheY-like chemotaxis protein
MADEVKRHLFEPFFTTKKVGEGTGMGLAGVYGTVRNHHGAIHIQSEVGRGTTIRIDLPLAPGMIKADEPETSVAPVRGTANILLVDDERTVREMATDVLCDLGYSVATCADGQEAVEYYKEHWRKLDLVILDMVMPRLGGHETFVAMQKINPRIRALLSSGYSLNGDAQTILDEGVLGFVGKPYQRTDLAQKISEALSADL